MKRTHRSLYYLASYLTLGGVALIVSPRFFVKLLFSNQEYTDVSLRFLGILLVSLAMIVIQIIRLKVEALYTTTLVVRIFISIGLIGLYSYSNDPLFLSLLVIVGLGIVMTVVSYVRDRKKPATGGRN